MCTVSYIPTKTGVCITSNRDEHISRRAILSPQEHVANGQKILYPEDAGAGGTWFAVNEHGGVVVLLNGAFENHKRTPPYAKSRGLVVLDVVGQTEPIAYLNALDLGNIEPFTLVVYQHTKLWEFRWDGSGKHFRQKDSSQPHIWSSATLYDAKAIDYREQLFSGFVAADALTPKSAVAFHRNNHGDLQNGFVIDRENGLKTLSITQVVLSRQQLVLAHLDLDSEHTASASLEMKPPVTSLS